MFLYLPTYKGIFELPIVVNARLYVFRTNFYQHILRNMLREKLINDTRNSAIQIIMNIGIIKGV